MKTTFALALALGLLAAPAGAQTPPAPAGVHAIKLSNTEKQAITAIYASPPGRNDWGEDLLGKQVGGAGKTVNLKISSAACTVDLQMLMTDGTMVTKSGVDVCATPEYRFSRQTPPAAPPTPGG